MEAEIWRWIWLGAAGVFLLGEVIIAGGVFMLPFAGGAVVASILAFAGLGDAPQWIAFIVVSAALFIAFFPKHTKPCPPDGLRGGGVGVCFKYRLGLLLTRFFNKT